MGNTIMRKFSEILIESKKTYNFIIRIAGDMPEGCADTMKTSLEKFDLVSFTGPKRTPIQETPMDFPQLQNMEVHTFEAEVSYPTVGHILERYLVDCCGVDHTHLNVRVPGEPVELEQREQKESEVYEPLIGKEDLGGESAQQEVGGARVMDLLKELEVARAERNIEPSGDVAQTESKDINDSQNNKAVVGG
jgi:hypothetical protein|tara:strand:- start:709 stop:1284 length:576 start_codon:yes stop_codon:yes gene_type:complete